MPTERMLSWAAAAIRFGATVTDVRSLHGDDAPWMLQIEHARGTTTAVLRAPTPNVWPFMIATGAAALKAAKRHGLAAPRLISADLDASQTGALTSLETVVPGTTEWSAPTSTERLQAAGAALAAVHAIAKRRSEHLPYRPRPIAVDNFAADRRAGRMPTTPLLEEADRRVRAHGRPGGKTVFVHGDVWPGNIIWTEDEQPILIDWKTAGVGAPGVDLGELRKQVAIIFGPDAPDTVLEGWERASGTKAGHVDYWDAVAALNTTTELGDGRRPHATARRNAFLETALTNLDK